MVQPRCTIGLSSIVLPVACHCNLLSNRKNSDQRKVKLSDPDRERDINLLLGKALAKANDIFVTYRLSEKQLTPKLFKVAYANPSLRNDLLTFMEKEMAAHKGYVTADTIATYHTTLHHLKALYQLSGDHT